MIRRPPRSTRTDTLFPYTTLFRSELEAAVDGIVAGQRRHEKIPYDVRFRALLHFLDYRQSLPPLSTSLLRGLGPIMGPNHIVHDITDPNTPHGFRRRTREIHIASLIRHMGIVSTLYFTLHTP